MTISLFGNVVKAEPKGEPEKASNHGSTRPNRSNQWFDRITVELKCEAVNGWISPIVRSSSYNTGLKYFKADHIYPELCMKILYNICSLQLKY